MIGHRLVNAHNNGDCDSYTCPICEFLDEQEAADEPCDRCVIVPTPGGECICR